MRSAQTLRRVLLASVFSMAVVACADTDIASPGATTTSPPPPPPPPPPVVTGPTVVQLATAAECAAAGTVGFDGEGNPLTLRQSDPIVISEDLQVRTCEFPNLSAGGVLPANAVFPAIASANAPAEFGGIAPILLSGVNSVGSDAGIGVADDSTINQTLTIEPGAVIIGATGPDVLVVSRGSQIIANGTPSAPIIFTSLGDYVDAQQGNARDGSYDGFGEWGGIVVNGFAPINDCDGALTADPVADAGSATCVKSGEGSSGLFGGDDPLDTSGTIRYVQVRFAGFRFTSDNELNGIAFQGVGRGRPTENADGTGAPVLTADQEPFEFIQVHNNTDDGLEWFGGTANARYLVVTGAGDDSLDWTDGWTGNLQYVLVDQNFGPESDNLIEADNRGNDQDVLPRSHPVVSNATLIGSGGDGVRLREGTAGLLTNTIIVNEGANCLRVDIEQDDAAISGAQLVTTDFLNLESVLCVGDVDPFAADGGANLANVIFNKDSAFFAEVIFEDDDGDSVVKREGDAIRSNFTFPYTIEQFTGLALEDGAGVITGANPTITATESTLVQTYFPGPAEFGVPALDLTITGSAFDNASGGEPGRTGVDLATASPLAVDGAGNTIANSGFDPSFFDSVDFIGAFGPNDRPGNALGDNWASGWTFGIDLNQAATGGTAGCPTGTVDTGDTQTDLDGADKPVCRLSGTLTQDITLTAGNVYQINGVVSVGEDAAPVSAGGTNGAVSAILTIEPGVTLYGVNGPDVLVVSRGSQILANGTEAAPIVFTSDEDLNGLNTLGSERGQFGGLVINGQAPINDCDGRFVADVVAASGTVNCVKEGEGSSGFYGGDQAGDSSGILRYVQVRYAGFRFTPQNELNGIAFQGVGNGISSEADALLADGEQPFEFIHIHNNADDGLEWFGGTANGRYLVVTGAGDDSIDWTDGWTGNVQFLVVEQGNGNNDNGFEGDNRGNDEDLDNPRSNPTFSNVTIIGSPDGARGLRLRAGTAGTIANIIIRGTGGAAVYADEEQLGNAGGVAGVDLIGTDALRLRSAFLDTDVPFDGDGSAEPWSGGDEALALFSADPNNVRRPDAALGTVIGSLQGFTFFPAGNSGIGLIPTTAGAEADVPFFDLSTAPVSPGFDATFFETVDYIGAVAPGTADADAWFTGWTFLDPESAR